MADRKERHPQLIQSIKESTKVLALAISLTAVLASASPLRGGIPPADASEPSTRKLQDDPFTVDLYHAVCPDLAEINRNIAPTQEACAAYCEADPGCDLWQYCPEVDGTVSSCNLHDSLGDAWSPGNWVRCYVSTAASSRESCLPDKFGHWVGRARSSSSGVRVPATTAPVARKRGLSAYLNVDVPDGTVNPPTCADGEALGMQDSWYYTWQARSSSGNHCAKVDRLWGAGPNANGGGGVQLGQEFVPMAIGVGQAQNILDNIDHYRAMWTRANVHYLLGYNEPDPSPNHPHSVEADVAAQDWPLVQQVAAAFDPPLKLVSPAPASEDFDEDGRSKWLDAFFGNCTLVPECDPSLIEIIAFHDYKGSVDLLRRRIDGMTAHYGNRPLWLTEYSIGRWDPPNGPERPEQNAYLQESLLLLENHPAIFRYVWFHSRDGPGPWGGVKDLLVYDQQEPNITSTGEIYRDWPEGPQPTHSPTASPTVAPATSTPTKIPTAAPTTIAPTPLSSKNPTKTPTKSPTKAPAVLTYEAEPGLFLLLGEPGESCTSACTRSAMHCSYNSLSHGAPYSSASTMAATVSNLGVECSRVKDEVNGRAFPQIRPDKRFCNPKNPASTNFGCDDVSTWVVLGQRVCSCVANINVATGVSCDHSAECASGVCHGDGYCVDASLN